jgi:hypothetical protein
MDPRLLLVVSGSHGDLSAAIAFVYGQEWAGNAAVALPDKLYHLNRGRLPVHVYRYASVEDIVQAAVTWEARVVIFLSAYGFPIERLTTPAGVQQLVRRLRDENCRVATTDPFLGSASAIVEDDVREMLPPVPGWLFRPLLGRLARRITRALKESHDVLRDVTHLYPMPVDGIIDRTRLRAVSFFNPEVTRRHRGWEDTTEKHTAPSARRPSWLFVLGPNDVFIQQRKGGLRRFQKRLMAMFEQAAGAGRRPQLVAPELFMAKLARVLPAGSATQLVPFCSYPEFTTRLLDAEYAFYWNAFSCSAVLVRMVKKLPVFFFDQGHVARFSRRIYEDGVRGYYGGWQPSTLPSEHLDPAALVDLAAEQNRKVDELVAYWGRSPGPRDAINLLLSAPG